MFRIPIPCLRLLPCFSSGFIFLIFLNPNKSDILILNLYIYFTTFSLVCKATSRRYETMLSATLVSAVSKCSKPTYGQICSKPAPADFYLQGAGCCFEIILFIFYLLSVITRTAGACTPASPRASMMLCVRSK